MLPKATVSSCNGTVPIITPKKNSLKEISEAPKINPNEEPGNTGLACAIADDFHLWLDIR